MLKRRHRAGFTLPEVLTSMALIGVLASIVVPTVRGRMEDGYQDAVIQEFQSLSSALAGIGRTSGTIHRRWIISPRSPRIRETSAATRSVRTTS